MYETENNIKYYKYMAVHFKHLEEHIGVLICNQASRQLQLSRRKVNQFQFSAATEAGHFTFNSYHNIFGQHSLNSNSASINYVFSQHSVNTQLSIYEFSSPSLSLLSPSTPHARAAQLPFLHRRVGSTPQRRPPPSAQQQQELRRRPSLCLNSVAAQSRRRPPQPHRTTRRPSSFQAQSAHLPFIPDVLYRPALLSPLRPPAQPLIFMSQLVKANPSSCRLVQTALELVYRPAPEMQVGERGLPGRRQIDYGAPTGEILG